MARRDAVPSARAGKATPIVVLLLLAVAAAGFYATVPDFFAARDGARVELAALAAARWDAAARAYVEDEWRESVSDVTAEMVDRYYERHDEPPVVWPAAADLSTLDVSDTNGVSVVVRLHGGPRRVSAADRLRPEGNP